jgi:hypothetical protein
MCNSQVSDTTKIKTLIIEEKDGLISSAAFSKAVTTDLNYLIFNDLSPQQGASASIKDDGSQILFNGILYTGNIGALTASANLSSTKGVYFFDEDNGGDDATITLSFFRHYCRKYYYQTNSDLELISLNLKTVKLLSDTKAKMDYLFSQIVQLVSIKYLSENVVIGSQSKELFISEENADYIVDTLNYKESKKYKILDDELQALSAMYINDQFIKGYAVLPKGSVETRDFTKKPNDTSFVQLNVNDGKKNKFYSFKYNTNLPALFEEYVKLREFILKGELEDEIIEQQITASAEYWTSKHLIFYSLHPFYKRESLSVFDTTTKTIDNIDGDIFGITISPINYSYQNLQRNRPWYHPKNLFFRAGISASRASNRAGFKESNITIDRNLGVDDNGNAITSTSAANAFIGNNAYQYGNSLGFNADIIIYPVELPVGLFASIGYSKLQFPSSTGIDDIELSPMRLGALINFKKKGSEKDNVVVQLFIDRTDLSLAPNGNDNDLRVGLGIGIPFKF